MDLIPAARVSAVSWETETSHVIIKKIINPKIIQNKAFSTIGIIIIIILLGGILAYVFLFTKEKYSNLESFGREFAEALREQDINTLEEFVHPEVKEYYFQKNSDMINEEIGELLKASRFISEHHEIVVNDLTELYFEKGYNPETQELGGQEKVFLPISPQKFIQITFNERSAREGDLPALIVIVPVAQKNNAWYWIVPDDQKSTETTQEEYEQLLEETETADWQTYRNEEYRFEVNYPEEPDWEIHETPLPYGIQIKFGSQDCIWVSVIENPKNLSVEKYYEEGYKDYTEEECKTADNFCSCFRYEKNIFRTNIAGIEAFRCEIVPGPLASTVILVSANNFIFHIGKIYTEYEEYKGLCTQLNSNEIFDQILSTFRFLD